MEITLTTEQALDKLSKDFESRFQSFMQSMAEVARDSVKTTTVFNDQTGNLRSNFKVEISSDTLYLSDNMPYANFVNNGRPAIFAKNGKALKFTINGVTLFRKSVGPAKARPFFTDAISAVQSQAQSKFTEIFKG
jgi:hypothetical protein